MGRDEGQSGRVLFEGGGGAGALSTVPTVLPDSLPSQPTNLQKPHSRTVGA